MPPIRENIQDPRLCVDPILRQALLASHFFRHRQHGVLGLIRNPPNHITVSRHPRLGQLARQHPGSLSDQNYLDRAGIAKTHTKLLKLNPNVDGLHLHFYSV